jgi:hypothetical protein
MDMIALKRASDGNPDQLIAVKRILLADAYARIVELDKPKGKKSKGGGTSNLPD